MKGKPEIISLLNDVLAGELVAINQYFLHAKMCSNWGYERLAAKVRKESFEEMHHAEELIERILFLEGFPDMQRLERLNIGKTVVEQFQKDLVLEIAAVERLNKGVIQARELGDNRTETLLSHILAEEEEHIDWLEAQLALIAQVGEQNYLAEQIKE